MRPRETPLKYLTGPCCNLHDFTDPVTKQKGCRGLMEHPKAVNLRSAYANDE